jgi:hypothetical protein
MKKLDAVLLRIFNDPDCIANAKGALTFAAFTGEPAFIQVDWADSGTQQARKAGAKWKGLTIIHADGSIGKI